MLDSSLGDAASAMPGRVPYAGDGFILAAFQRASTGGRASLASQAGSAIAFEAEWVNAEVSHLNQRGAMLLHRAIAGNGLRRHVAILDPFGVVHRLFEPTAG